jgi:predicted nucleic acid-binding protein
MPADRLAWAYFDTSVLVKCYVQEHGTPEALSLIGRHAVLSSALAPIEVTSALRRQEASGGLARRQREQALVRLRGDRARWNLLELDWHVLARAEALAGTAPVGTLDALHLASALVFQAETNLRPPFITGDTQQRRAAEGLGLDVVFVG